ncbi:MAG: hypothetical protein L6R36_008899 [Xanthoria steineri]|nr:MAG: hypothetical protein L6R36_008899 [Xanthoria steineri]
MAQALLVVVVTTYSTWHLRTTYIESPQERRRLRKLAKAEDEPDEDDHGTESEGESDELGSQRRSWIPGVFERLICDEAQKIKDPTTRSNRALRLLGASKSDDEQLDHYRSTVYKDIEWKEQTRAPVIKTSRFQL